MQHSVLALEGLVDKLRALSTSLVLKRDFHGAEFPSLDILRDVQSFSDISTAVVVNNGVAESARRETVGTIVVQEGCVISGGVGTVGGGVVGVHLGVGLRAVADAKDVVNVDIGDEGVELSEESLAGIGGLGGHATEVAVVVEDLLTERIIIEGVPVSHFDVGGCAVVVVVSNTVSDHETLQVWLEDGIITSVLSVVVINPLGKVGHVDSGVGLSRDVQIVGSELGEFGVPVEDSEQIVISGLGVGVRVALLSVTVALGEADACRGLDVEHVSFLVPGPLVLSPEVGATVQLVGTVFLGESEHGRASGTTVEPDDDGVVGGVVLGLDEHVVEGLVLVDVKVAGVDGVGVEGGHVGHGEDSVGFISSEGRTDDGGDGK